MSTNDDIRLRLELACELAKLAGDRTREYFLQDDVQVDRKADDSPVTVADRESEQLMRERITGTFPGDGLHGEEFGEQAGTSDFRWVLDPIDGTKSFISGVPLYCVLIGILRGTESVAGVIHVPGLRETVFAARGAGAWWQRPGKTEPVRARVSERPLADGLFVTSQVDSFAQRQAADCFRQLEAEAYLTRTWGDGYGYLLVATGRAEAMVDPQMEIWDAAAILPVLKEAGGCFTDWQGEATVHHGEGVGCTPAVQSRVLSITRQFPAPA